ncbi:MAG: RNA polymerase sigma factor [Bacteroidota bacterium]
MRPSFTEQLQPHYAAAVRYCRALCARSPAAEADDVLQDALLKAVEHYGRLRDPERFKSWLFQIITRTFYSAQRRSYWRRFLPFSEVPEVNQMPSVYHAEADRLLIIQALTRLSDRQRSALLLYEVAGFSVEEIAQIQGDRSRSAVKSRLSRARHTLRQTIDALEQGHSPTRHSSDDTTDLDYETLNLVAALDRRTA